MKNFVQRGESVTVPAPADVSPGALVVIGALVGVASTFATTGEPVALATRGVFELPKATGALAIGAAVQWGASSKVEALDTGSRIGVVVRAAGANDTVVHVRLDG